jgi:hypothetical protein
MTVDARPIDGFLEGRREAIEQQLCGTCGGAAQWFRDTKSQAEYRISSMCQKCQDGFFSIRTGVFDLYGDTCTITIEVDVKFDRSVTIEAYAVKGSTNDPVDILEVGLWTVGADVIKNPAKAGSLIMTVRTTVGQWALANNVRLDDGIRDAMRTLSDFQQFVLNAAKSP